MRRGDVVRLARPEEVPWLAEIARRASPGASTAAFAPASLARLRVSLAAKALWVAVCDDVVVGFAAAEVPDGRAWLAGVWVAADHQGRGLGTGLIEEALLWGLREGRREIYASAAPDPPRCAAFLARLGFVPLHPAEAPEPPATITMDTPTSKPAVLRRSLDLAVLEPWGWNDWFAQRLVASEPPRGNGVEPGRVVVESRGIHEIVTAAGALSAHVAGRLKRHQRHATQPAIGDWVLVRLPERRSEHGLIEAVLERRSRFSRKVAGARTEEQVVAANVDRVFVVMGLDGDFNPRRLERYLVTTRRSGAQPIVVLNKSDLAARLEAQLAEVRSVAGDAPVHVAAAKHEVGLDELRPYLIPGETIALVGSSGVGKSTLVNRLYGETLMRTRKVREADERGQHTTTHRQLVRLPNGCLLIDNPGMRELQLWDVEEAVEETFADIERFAAACRFRDCEHAAEPGCAVREAVEQGELPEPRLDSYRKFVAELRALERRQDEAARIAEKQRLKSVHKAMKKHKKKGY